MTLDLLPACSSARLCVGPTRWKKVLKEASLHLPANRKRIFALLYFSILSVLGYLASAVFIWFELDYASHCLRSVSIRVNTLFSAYSHIQLREIAFTRKRAREAFKRLLVGVMVLGIFGQLFQNFLRFCSRFIYFPLNILSCFSGLKEFYENYWISQIFSFFREQLMTVAEYARWIN